MLTTRRDGTCHLKIRTDKKKEKEMVCYATQPELSNATSDMEPNKKPKQDKEGVTSGRRRQR